MTGVPNDDLNELCDNLESGWAKAKGELETVTKKKKGRGTKRTFARMRLFDAFASSLYRMPPTATVVWYYLLSKCDDRGYVRDQSLAAIGKGIGRHRDRVAEALKHLSPEYVEVIDDTKGKTPVYLLRNGT